MWAATGRGPGRGLVILDVRGLLGLDGCEILVIRVPVCPVCVPAPPSVFLPMPVDARLSPFISRSSGRHEAAAVYRYTGQSARTGT